MWLGRHVPQLHRGINTADMACLCCSPRPDEPADDSAVAADVVVRTARRANCAAPGSCWRRCHLTVAEYRVHTHTLWVHALTSRTQRFLAALIGGFGKVLRLSVSPNTTRAVAWSSYAATNWSSVSGTGVISTLSAAIAAVAADGAPTAHQYPVRHDLLLLRRDMLLPRGQRPQQNWPRRGCRWVPQLPRRTDLHPRDRRQYLEPVDQQY